MQVPQTAVMDVRQIGRRIAYCRERLRLKQQELAKRAGLSEAYVNRLENGLVGNPKIYHLALVARALAIPLDPLLFGDSPQTEEEIQTYLGRQPRLASAISSLARGLEWADPADREFVLNHLESLAGRFGYQPSGEQGDDQAASNTAQEARRPRAVAVHTLAGQAAVRCSVGRHPPIA